MSEIQSDSWVFDPSRVLHVHRDSTEVDGALSLILAVHGFMDGPDSWAGMSGIEAFEGFSWVSADLRFIEPATNSDRSAIATYADRIADAFARSPWADAESIILIGHSMGGAIVELLARRLGDAVKATLLICPAPLRGYPLSNDMQEVFESRAITREPEAIAAGRGRLAPNASDEAMKTLVQTVMETPVPVALQQLSAWAVGDHDGRNPSDLSTPVHIVHSDDIFFTTAFLTETVAPRFADVTLHHVANAGHWPHVEQSQTVAEIVVKIASDVNALPLKGVNA